jgi:hypothetical protein
MGDSTGGRGRIEAAASGPLGAARVRSRCPCSAGIGSKIRSRSRQLLSQDSASTRCALVAVSGQSARLWREDLRCRPAGNRSLAALLLAFREAPEASRLSIDGVDSPLGGRGRVHRPLAYVPGQAAGQRAASVATSDDDAEGVASATGAPCGLRTLRAPPAWHATPRWSPQVVAGLIFR